MTMIFLFAFLLNAEKHYERKALNVCKNKSAELTHKYREQKHLFPPRSEDYLNKRCKEVVLKNDCDGIICRINAYKNYIIS